MNLILSPINNINKLVLNNVETFCQEGESLLVVYIDGRCRNYPMRHLWYWEATVPAGEARTKPPGKGYENEELSAGYAGLDFKEDPLHSEVKCICNGTGCLGCESK